MQRAVLLFGAGASIEYGAPSTAKMTALIESAVMSDPFMKSIGGDVAYTKIKSELANYLRDPADVNFEHIYHCAHELRFMYAPTKGAFNEFRPLLFPFINNISGIRQDSLKPLAHKIIEAIYNEVSQACSANTAELKPLSDFIALLRRDYITRIYTTNYDDFILQAAPDLYTGHPAAAKSPKPFEVDRFWGRENRDAIFYLHGSIHMGFPHPILEGNEASDLAWFDQREEAIKHALFHGGTRMSNRMDGSSYMPASVITGLDKLSRLQQRPLSYYYASMGRDLMLSDVIYVIGSGLGDLHLNSWLREARSRNPNIPVVFVDYWKHGLEAGNFELDSKSIEMFHALKIYIGDRYPSERVGTGWTISQDRSAAVWDKGFQDFLNAPDELKEVIKRLKFPKRPSWWHRVWKKVRNAYIFQ